MGQKHKVVHPSPAPIEIVLCYKLERWSDNQYDELYRFRCIGSAGSANWNVHLIEPNRALPSMDQRDQRVLLDLLRLHLERAVGRPVAALRRSIIRDLAAPMGDRQLQKEARHVV